MLKMENENFDIIFKDLVYAQNCGMGHRGGASV